MSFRLTGDIASLTDGLTGIENARTFGMSDGRVALTYTETVLDLSLRLHTVASFVIIGLDGEVETGPIRASGVDLDTAADVVKEAAIGVDAIGTTVVVTVVETIDTTQRVVTNSFSGTAQTASTVLSGFDVDAAETSGHVTLAGGNSIVVELNDFNNGALFSTSFDGFGASITGFQTLGDTDALAATRSGDGIAIFGRNTLNNTIDLVFANEIGTRTQVASGVATGVEIEAVGGRRVDDQLVATELSNGNLVAVWQDERSQGADTSGSSIRFLMTDAAGEVLVADTLVNVSGTAGDQTDPTVHALADGGFAISWQTPNTGQQIVTVQTAVQTFDATGAAIGTVQTFETLGTVADVVFTADGNGAIISNTGVATALAVSRHTVFEAEADGASLTGTDGADLMLGGAGADALLGGTGRDRMNGDAGNDTMDGGRKNDRIDGGEGDDEVSGGRGDDHIRGGEGDDVLMGNAGDDLITGQRGIDVLRGGNGADVILGGRGDDNLRGQAGNDELRGSTGSDTLGGGEGDDTLEGGLGDDQLAGGDGADTFVFTSGTRLGADTILDFARVSDTIQTDMKTELEVIQEVGTSVTFLGTEQQVVGTVVVEGVFDLDQSDISLLV